MGRMKQAAKDYGWLMLLYTLSSVTQMFPLVSFGSILNVELGLSASDVTFYYAAIFFPWNFRAFYGLLSDAVPLWGSRRKAYMGACYGAVAICFVLYGVFVDSVGSAFLVGVILNVFFSFSEAVLDAVAVDLVSAKPLDNNSAAGRVKRSTDIQSAGMTFRTLGSLIALPIAGGLSTVLTVRTMVCITAVFPIVSLVISLACIKERDVRPDPVHKKTLQFMAYLKVCVRERKWPRELIQTIKPVLLPSIFILLYAASPSSNQAFSNFLFTSLSFSQWEYHAISLCATIGSLLGTLLYWKLFRETSSLRAGFVASVIASAAAACSRLLVLHYWQSIYFVCIDEALVNAAFRITLMPVQVYASIAASAPEHLMYEGFVFGLFASIENWGGTLSGLISGALAQHVDLTTHIAIAAGVSFIPLLALNLLHAPDMGVERKSEDEPSAQRTDAPI